MALATLLLLAAGNALALGLGQIEVKSRLNEPLLAEIPIISTIPGELQALQARLASPETFRRVGLPPPQGVAADLRFSLGNDARGRPVIRVTTVAPVNQAVLNFLIEVDWGQGRLVREYSALIDVPRTASAPLQPAISAPVAAASNVVQRPVAPEAASNTTEPLQSGADAAVDVPVPPATQVAEPVPSSGEIISEPAETSTQDVAVAASATSTPSQYGPIQAGETLSKIAADLRNESPYSLDQTMLALLRANPDAFINDNINLVRQGAVLRVPSSEEMGSISADDARLVVREQMQQWRQARQAVIQPGAAVAGDASRDGDEPTSAAAASAKSTEAPQPEQARLAIVPAAAPGKATGTQSGTNVGGEGKMLQQQLQQRDEDLAARTAEISDLKERVAELEKLKQQQDQLLTMKDTELAAVQQRLADARKAGTAAATSEPAATVATETTQSAQEPQPHASSMMPWLWGSLAVVSIGLLAWLLSRRQSARVEPKPRRSLDHEALAASMRRPVAVPATESATESGSGQVAGVSEPKTQNAHVQAPTWHSGNVVKADAAPEMGRSAASSSPRFVPPAEEISPLSMPDALDQTPPEPVSAGQRMKLARAFLDIGDKHSAKQLLIELKESATDPMLRTEASKLLRDIG